MSRWFFKVQTWKVTPFHSRLVIKINVLSQSLRSYSDSQGALQRQGEVFEGLMYLECKAFCLTIGKVEQTLQRNVAYKLKGARMVEGRGWVKGCGASLRRPEFTSCLKLTRLFLNLTTCLVLKLNQSGVELVHQDKLHRKCRPETLKQRLSTCCSSRMVYRTPKGTLCIWITCNKLSLSDDLGWERIARVQKGFFFCLDSHVNSLTWVSGHLCWYKQIIQITLTPVGFVFLSVIFFFFGHLTSPCWTPSVSTNLVFCFFFYSSICLPPLG